MIGLASAVCTTIFNLINSTWIFFLGGGGLETFNSAPITAGFGHFEYWDHF